jgi:hypothetical protein
MAGPSFHSPLFDERGPVEYSVSMELLIIHDSIAALPLRLSAGAFCNTQEDCDAHRLGG